MVRHYNFSPGPAMLPTEVMEQAQEEFLSWKGRGLSVMEDTHRGKDFDGLMANLQNNLRSLMNIPSDYSVIFAQGGATLQNSLIPLNLLGMGGSKGPSADYLVSGAWSEKTYNDATIRWPVRLCHDTRDSGCVDFPELNQIDVDPSATYLHYAMNETIHGVVGHLSRDDVGVPLISDVSSCILSEPIDVSKHDMLYAGAQKNLGPAGIALAIISPALLDKAADDLPTMLSWKKQVENNSMQNTAPTFTLYMVDLVVQWVVDQGGVEVMEQRCREKAGVLYRYLDNSNFYKNPVTQGARSICNMPFTLADDGLNDTFIKQSTEAGLLNLKGHRLVGGMRASMYNSMPMEGVKALVDFLGEFERKNG